MTEPELLAIDFQLLDGYVSEVTQVMTLVGARSVDELDRSMVRRLARLERL